MRASRSWMLVITLLLVASMMSTGVICGYIDRETSAGNTVTGYVPSSWTQTTLADFSAGMVGRTDVTAVPGSAVLGSEHTDPGVFVLVGGTSKAFYRYNMTSRAWRAVASVPVTMGDGSSMVYDEAGHIYALVGGSSTAIYRYDVLSNAWALFATAPGPIGKGGDLLINGSILYVLQGSTGKNIWTYGLATLKWTTLATAPKSTGTGASILLQNNILYWARGGSTNEFWGYGISTGTWTRLANAAGNMGAGADMVIGGGGLFYGSYGGDSNRLMERYNGSTNAWTSLASQTNDVRDGGGLAFDGHTTIFSINGNMQAYFYAYNTTTNTWAPGTSVPEAVTTGGCIVHVPSIRIAYYGSGTFTSEAFDTGAEGMKYVQAFWDIKSPTSTTVTLEVRVSDMLLNGVPAGSWQNLGSGASGTMSGLTGRYVQWRATLTTSNAAVTPELQEVRVYYYPG